MDENYKKYKKEKHIIAILIMIIVLLAASLVSLIILKSGDKPKSEPKEANASTENTDNKVEPKKEEENKENEKIDSNEGVYYIKKGNNYEAKDKNGDAKGSTISFNYPIINSKSSSATSINSEIKKLYDEKENYLLNKFPEETGCTCVIINNKEKCGRAVKYYKYNIVETDEIINIQIIDSGLNYCGSSDSEIIKSYFVSKTTGEVLNSSQAISSFKYEDTKLVSAYNTYLRKLKEEHNDMFTEYKEISNVSELKVIITKNQKLGVYGPFYGNGKVTEIEFNGEKLYVLDEN